MNTLTDETIIEILIDHLPPEAGFYLFSELDESSGLPVGTAKRFGAIAARHTGQFVKVTNDGIRLSHRSIILPL